MIKKVKKYVSNYLRRLKATKGYCPIIVTQDVFEHVMEPAKAFKEIARALKSGGAHISMPWYPQLKTTAQRARFEAGQVVHLEEPVYHGNLIDWKKGSLVTFDRGRDFVDFIHKESGMYTMVYLQNNVIKGIEGEFLEIFIRRKS